MRKEGGVVREEVELLSAGAGADEHVKHVAADLGYPGAEDGEVVQREPREDVERLRGTEVHTFFALLRLCPSRL
jgi:hypothetical protein